jgi:hypothetical protein
MSEAVKLTIKERARIAAEQAKSSAPPRAPRPVEPYPAPPRPQPPAAQLPKNFQLPKPAGLPQLPDQGTSES